MKIGPRRISRVLEHLGGSGMSDELDIIIVDDDPTVCKLISDIIKRFYTWGEVLAFTDVDEASLYCLNRDVGVGIFVIDVYLGGQSGFHFLETIKEKFPAAHEDAIIITGNASNEVVDRCIQADVNYLLEKPMKAYALQLSVRSIVMKYIKFAKRLLQDPVFARNVSHIE